MADISPEFRDGLEAAGKLKSFSRRWEELCAEGMDRDDARLKATREYASSAEKGQLILKNRERDRKAYKQKGNVKAASCEVELVPKAEFEGHTASEAEIVRWVARHMNVEVQPSEAPDPIAWNLLQHCRQDASARSDFWKQTYPKLLPTRAQLGDDKSEEELDGTPQLETINRIRLIKAKAEREAGVA